MNKKSMNKIVAQIKGGLKLQSAMKPAPKPKSPVLNPVKNVTHRERDMRDEAISMGSHQAKEYFGGKK